MAYDKVVDSAALDTQLTSIADAIRAKTGRPASLTIDEMPTEIASIQTGGGGGSTAPVSANDVTFYDYDGSIVASYTLAQAKALMELPALPVHDGLVCQGWNWTLEAIKALNCPVTVGAMYITDDGATRLHIRIATVGRMTVPLCIGQTVANGVAIDWGDGSTVETLAGTGNKKTTHTYAKPGDYVISLMPEDECTLSFGANPSSYCVMGETGGKGEVYCNMLQEVCIGKNVASISNNAFISCCSLASIAIPDGVTSIGNNVFNSCRSLASIAIPDGVTSIGNNVFAYCYSLASIAIPDGVTSIGNNAFNSCYSLASIAIPDGVTSIGNNVFAYCCSLASIAIPDGVTSIGNNVFAYCYSLASIAIPDGVTSIGNNVFISCYSLASIAIPDGVTSIGNNAFNSCYSLASIAIPDGVTSIGDNAFAYCYGMRYYDFSSCTSIPTLSSTNAFSNIQSDCQMLIPAALYDEWSAATNWAIYASKMVAV